VTKCDENSVENHPLVVAGDSQNCSFCESVIASFWIFRHNLGDESQATSPEISRVSEIRVYSYAPHSGVRDFQIRFDTSLNELDLCG
jgi:hypothetical protein